MGQFGDRGAIDTRSAAVLRAWNLMRGIDWAALPAVAELVGLDDVELLVEGLVQVRDYVESKDGKPGAN